MRPARELIALGLLQGATEMLPVSSSAHVALLHPGALDAAERKELEVALHLGSAVGLLATARRVRPAFLAAATAPPALAGLVLGGRVERHLGTPRTIAAGLALGSLAMLAADRAPQARAEPGWRDGLALGLAQACALWPGVSRSGASWAAARARGFTRPAAMELSREAALPVLAGAAALKARNLRPLGPALAAAAAATAVMRRVPLGTAPAWPWAAYRTALATAVLAVRETRRG